jgi:hypothetical protein
MTVHDDVIFDLLPLYRAGRASEASRALVETWLARHPTLSVGPTEDSEAERSSALSVLRAAKRRARMRRWLFGLALGLTGVLCSVGISREPGDFVRVRLMALDFPWQFAPVAIAATLLWLLYWRASRPDD